MSSYAAMSVDHLTEDRRPVRDTIIDLVATWGAVADPHLAPVLESIDHRSNLAQTLAFLRTGTHDLLPADLREEIDAALAVLQAGGRASAPSFRARLVRLADRAAEALGPALESGRLEIVCLLEERWTALGDEPIAAALEVLWSDAEASTLAGRIGAIGRIRKAISGLREAAPSVGGGPASPAPDRRAAPPAPGDPAEAQALETRFASVIARAERSIGASPEAPVVPGSLGTRLRLAVGRLHPDLVRTAGGPEADTLLRLWEEEILQDLEGEAKRAGQQAERRAAIASTLAGLAPDNPGGREAASLAATARELAPAGGPQFYEAVERASEHLAEAERASAKVVEAAGSRLREAARELEALLQKEAAHLPTERVVASRLLLEQALGVLQAGRREEIEAHTAAIRKQTGAANQLSEARRDTTQKREEHQREELVAAIRKLALIAPRGQARALARLEADLGRRGQAFDAQRARQAFDTIAIAIEQGLRLPAARTLAAARARLKARGRGSGGADGAVAGLRAASEALAAALAGDELEEIRSQGDIVRDLLLRASPWQRPTVRRAAAGAAILLAAGLLIGWILYQKRAHAVRLDLPGPWSTVWVVRDGHVVERRDRRGTETRPEFRLPPGQYELYVDARYTGRRFSVPGESLIDDIIPPRPSETAGSTGADDDHSPPR